MLETEFAFSSWPGSSRPSTAFLRESSEDVDARHKAGHDDLAEQPRPSAAIYIHGAPAWPGFSISTGAPAAGRYGPTNGPAPATTNARIAARGTCRRSTA